MVLCALGIFVRGEYGLRRFDGLILLVCFAFYLWYNLKGEHTSDSMEEGTEVTGRYKSMTVCAIYPLWFGRTYPWWRYVC